MTHSRSSLVLACVWLAVFGLTACGAPQSEPAASPYAGGGEAEGGTQDTAAASQADGEPALDPLDVAAREACAAGDEGFSAGLPEGSAFAARGGDGRVHAAWREDGSTYEAVIHTPSLDQEARSAFDRAVAELLRRNLTAGFDRTGLTGAFRFRDGRFCVIQTEAEAIAPFQAAVREAEAAVTAADE